MLFFLATSSAWAQTNVVLTNITDRGGLTPTAHLIHAQTNQLPSAVQLAEQVRTECIQGRRSIAGRILRVLPDGLVVDSGYTNLARSPLESSWLVPGTLTAHRAPNLVEANEPDSLCAGQVFLTDVPNSRGAKPHQYDYVIIRGYPTGHYTYTSVGNIQRTARRFSASLDKATRLNFAAAVNRAQPVTSEQTHGEDSAHSK